MERDLGLRLLKRTTKKVDLTEEGLGYFARCRRILEEAEVAHEELTATRHHARGHLRVAATADFGLRLVAGLPAFLREHPDLTLEFDFTSRRVDPLTENCDLAIYIGTPPDSGLTARKTAEVPMFLYASPEYLRRHGKPTRPAQLGEHECIREGRFDGSGTERRWTLLRGGARVEVEIGGRLSLNSIGLIRRFAAQGLGIALLPEGLCREDVEAGRLRGCWRTGARRGCRSTP